MKHKAIVLGCGMVGATMARDMAADDAFEVSVADVSEANLGKVAGDPRVATVRADLSDSTVLRKLIEPFDVVLGALPSRFGFAALTTVIEAGKPYSDISFMPEDAMALDEQARHRGVTAVVDCGVSPGLSNLFVGYAYAQLDETDSALIYVGGLPKVRRWPFEYKAPFAPSDVIEEYTRPARFILGGKIVTAAALSEPELIDFDRVGTLEAFNTDGLRSLLTTIPIPDMREKTLRFPGHIELMRVFRETGFFGKDEIDMGGVKVRPLDVTQALMFPKWHLAEDDEEFTVLRVVVEGTKDARKTRFTFDLYDETDRESNTHSMARTTAFPNAIVARMLAQKQVNAPGVIPPERLAAPPGLCDQIGLELKKRKQTIHLAIRGMRHTARRYAAVAVSHCAGLTCCCPFGTK